MKKKKILLIIAIIICIVVLDQLSKWIVEKNFSGQTVGGHILSIEVTNNTGMAFGFNDGNLKNIGLTVFTLIIIINFVIKQFDQIDYKTAVAISFVIGGGLGNLIDRIIRGSVLDFIKVFKFPNFNVADTFIVIGWLLIAIFLAIFTRSGEKE